jgi:hypothetical protein
MHLVSGILISRTSAKPIGRFRNFPDSSTVWKRGRRPFKRTFFSLSLPFLTELGADALTRLRLQILCQNLDQQLSLLSQICGHFSSFLFSVEDLRIKTDRMFHDDDEHWPRLIRIFDGTKHLSVGSDLATDVLRALRPADEGHGISLPALQSLRVFPQGVFASAPLRDSVKSFLTQRRLSSHPIRLYCGPLPTAKDYRALLANIPQDSSVMTPESMSTLPRFSYTSGAALKAHLVSSHVVAYVEQHRDLLQHVLQAESRFHVGLTSTNNLPLVNLISRPRFSVAFHHCPFPIIRSSTRHGRFLRKRKRRVNPILCSRPK